MIDPGPHLIPISIPPPRCARCRRQVDLFESYDDVFRDVHVFVVRCHGEREQIEIPRTLFVRATTVQFDEAFSLKSGHHLAR